MAAADTAPALAQMLAGLTQQVQGTAPALLERLVRGLLIHLHHRCSNLAAVRWTPAAAAQPLMVVTPTSFRGQGRIEVDADVVFGVVNSPESWACSYFEARAPQSVIAIGEGSMVAAASQVPPGFAAPPRSIVAGNSALVVGTVPG